MKRLAKSSKSFHRRDKERGEPATQVRGIFAVRNIILTLHEGRKKTHQLLIKQVHKRPPAIFFALFIVKKATRFQEIVFALEDLHSYFQYQRDERLPWQSTSRRRINTQLMGNMCEGDETTSLV